MTKSIVEVIHELGLTYETTLDEFVTWRANGDTFNETITVLVDAQSGAITIERDRGEDAPLFSVTFSGNDPVIEKVLSHLLGK